MQIVLLLIFLSASLLTGQPVVTGRVLDPQGRSVTGAQVRLETVEAESNSEGGFRLEKLPLGKFVLTATHPSFFPVTAVVSIAPNQLQILNLRFVQLAKQSQTVVITATTNEPTIDTRNEEVFIALCSRVTTKCCSS